MKKIFLTAVIIFALAAPVFVSAQGIKDAGKVLNQIANPNQTGLEGDLATTVATVIKALLALVGTVFLVLTIYAGVLWMTAQGEPDKVEKAKEIIKASVIGLVIVLSAYSITYFVTSKLGAATGTSSNQQAVNDQCAQVSTKPDCEAIKTGGVQSCYWNQVTNKCF